MKRLLIKNKFQAALMAAPLFFAFQAVHAQTTPDFLWAKGLMGAEDAMGKAIAVDHSGNAYTTGNFTGTIDFDPNSGNADITAQGGGLNVYISKLNAQGAYVWAKQISADNVAEGRGITVDGSGNVYATGYFRGNADVLNGAATLNGIGGADIFISKLDDQGNLVWAKAFGGSGNDQPGGITSDDQGNIYVTGWFEGTVSFGGTSLSAQGAVDIFVCKLDGQGNVTWAKSMGGGLYDYGRSVDVDNQGNVYVTGNYEGTANFHTGGGTENLSANGSDDIFIAKLDSQGDLVWAKGIGGAEPDYGYSIAVDNSGNVYTTGWFVGNVDFDPGSGSFNMTSFGAEDIFVCKLDAQGNFAWAQQMGSSNSQQMMMGSHGQSIAIDASGDIYTTGYFRNDADFGATSLNSAGDQDIFISKMNAQGDFVWSFGMGGANADEGAGIALDPSGNIYTTGTFQVAADLDPGQGSANLNTPGKNAAFIQKMGTAGTGIDQQILHSNSLTIYPTPFEHQIQMQVTVSKAAPATLSVYDITGRKVSSTQAALTEGKNIISLISAFSKAAPGFYMVSLDLNNGEQLTGKVEKR